MMDWMEEGETMSEQELQARLLPLWRTVLNCPDLPADASFFENGGDSLLAARLTALLREALDQPGLSVRTVFRAPSAAQYAALASRF